MTAADRGASAGIVQRGSSDAGLDSVEWSATPLGPREQWPQSLHTAFSLCSALPVPACLVWRTARAQLFNERYRALWAPDCAPRAGQDFAASWATHWPALAPSFERACAGETVLLDTPPGLLQSARLRQHPVALAFIPVRAEQDTFGGVLVSVTGAQNEQERAGRDFELFDYVISHDLLAPARTMQELARILREDHAAALPTEAATFLGHFSRSTASLTARLEGLVRFREVSRQPLSCRTVDIAGLVRELVAEHRKSLTAPEVVIGDLPDATGDPRLLRQAFSAVISNAFKFVRDTPTPRIEIGARRDTGGLDSGRHDSGRNVYFVADNGAGFEMKYAGRLFGLFQRLHAEAQFEGTGVGLAIARRILERHGGAMRAEGSKGTGATFELILPAPGQEVDQEADHGAGP
jgi:signal transduction histidine kinase